MRNYRNLNYHFRLDFQLSNQSVKFVMLHKFIFLFCAIALGSSVLVRAETNSENNSRVKKFYSNFPGSDANKDKVLTLAEMRAFILKKVMRWISNGR